MRSEIRLEEGFINNSSCLRFGPACISPGPSALSRLPSIPFHIARVPHPRVDRAIVKLSGTLELCTLSFEMGRGRKLKEIEGEHVFCPKTYPLDNVKLFARATKSTHRLRASERNKRGTNDSRLDQSTTFVNNSASFRTLFFFRST